MASEKWKRLQQSRNRDRFAVRIGTVVTVVFTPLLFFLPSIVAVPAWTQWMGGVLGGIVAGGLTSERGNGAITGVKATGYGLLWTFALVVSTLIVYWMAIVGQVPPPIEQIFFVPLMPILGLFPAYLVSGILFGWGAAQVRSLAVTSRR